MSENNLTKQNFSLCKTGIKFYLKKNPSAHKKQRHLSKEPDLPVNHTLYA